MNEVVWERRDCVSAEVEDSVVLLDLDTLVYHSLNRTAAAVWDLLAEPATVSTIVGGMCSRFQIDAEHCRSSVERLLGELQRNKLIQPRPA